MKCIISLILIAIAVALGFWLSIYVLLYGGIMQAITNFGVNDSAVVCGIIKAVLFKFGLVPSYVLSAYGLALLE